jgi:predicted NodU family carbamoyl transferase
MKSISIGAITVSDAQHAALDAERIRYNKATEEQPATSVDEFVQRITVSNITSRANALIEREGSTVPAKDYDEAQAELTKLRTENERLQRENREKKPTE